MTQKLNLSKNRRILCHEDETVKCNGEPINFEDYAQHLMQFHKIPHTILELDGQELRGNYYANSLERGPFYSIFNITSVNEAEINKLKSKPFLLSRWCMVNVLNL